MPLWLFIFLAALAIISAFGVILQRSAVHCLLALAFALIVVGVLFVGLGAETVGFLQIIIYVGAIMVLFLFVIWLLNVPGETGLAGGHLALKLFGSIAAAALFAELFVIFFNAPAISHLRAVPPAYGSVQSLAALLFSHYLIAFEVTSLLLLAAVVGAIALARRLTGMATAEAAREADGEAASGRGSA